MLDLPKFDGSEAKAKSFLNDFDIAMLDRGVDDADDAKKGRYFVRCMIPDSRAERWIDRLNEATKKSYTALETSFKETFVGQGGINEVVRMGALQDMMKTKFRDSDVGKTDSNGVPLHIKYCEEMARLGNKVPTSTHDSTKVAAVFNGVGGGLGKVLRESPHDTFEEVLSSIKNITEWQIRDVQHWALIESMASTNRRALPISPALSTEELPPISRVPSYGEANRKREVYARSGDQLGADDRYRAITPAHQARIDEWEARYGAGAEVTAESNFPLTPGTEPAGSKECYKCGTKLPSVHIARECPNKWVNTREQNFRFKVSEVKRTQGNQYGRQGNQRSGNGQGYASNQGYNAYNNAPYNNSGPYNNYYASGPNRAPIGRQTAVVGAMDWEEDDEEEEGLNWMAFQGNVGGRGL